MRWSQALIPTQKETPADAVAPSHVLLLRAGMIRQLGAGAYTYLPLGFRVLNKAVRIVREEMDAAGALELLMPALQPVELWKESGRFETFGDVLMKLTLGGDQADGARADARRGRSPTWSATSSSRTSNCRSRSTRSRPSSATSPGPGSASCGPASS